MGCCFSAYMVSCLLMQHSIMSEKIARRGVRVPTEYTADALDQILVSDVMTPNVISVRADDTVKKIREWLTSGGSAHQGFPVLMASGTLAGIVTRKDLLNAALPGDKTMLDVIRRIPVVVYSDCSLRAATEHMVNHGIGRLPVVLRDEPKKIVGMITRSDILSANRHRMEEHSNPSAQIKISLGVFGI